VSIITPPHPSSKSFQVIDNIPVHTLNGSGNSVMSRELFRRHAGNFALKMHPRPHVVQFFNISSLSDFTALIKLKQSRIGSVLVNTMSGDVSVDNSKIKAMLQLLKFKLIHSLLNRIVNSNDFLTEQYKKRGLSANKLETIVNGVSLERFRPVVDHNEKIELQKRLNFQPGQTVLFVGNITPRKGVVELIKAWEIVHKKVPSHRLIMVGPELRHADKYKKFYQEWDEMLAKTNAKESIDIRPAAKNIEEYFRAADLFVFLSKVEGMPNVLPEAMASGLPILTDKFRGFSHELGRDGMEFEMTGRDPEEVSQRILMLLKDEKRRIELSNHGRLWVEKYHDVEKSMDQFAELYKSIAHLGRKQRR